MIRMCGYNNVMKIDPGRITDLNQRPVRADGECVLYWMQVDQRAQDNWALLRAVELGNRLKLPVIVGFVLYKTPKNAFLRHYDFMLRGLAETALTLRKNKIGFVMIAGEPVGTLVELSKELKSAIVVTDQSYLKRGKHLRTEVANQLDMRLEAVDAATIVPPSLAYPKAAYGAYLLRPKLRAFRERFLTDFPSLTVDTAWKGEILNAIDEQNIEAMLLKVKPDDSVPIASLPSGSIAAHTAMHEFIEQGFEQYAKQRNDPTVQATSRLSAYLRFGQLSSQRVAWEVLNSEAYEQNPDAGEGFLDELITWRELAVNVVLYNPHYSSYEGIPAWARRSLENHAADTREFLYTVAEFEAANTHDDLWNAAQMEMVRTGRMHGYMRMYWAKKVLEWSRSAAEAIQTCIYLNDKYFLDGRSANGYVGILWAIGGSQDRPWFDRPVYGQVRYMSYGGAKSKFKIPAYVDWVSSL